jgi:hypothetical protein
MTKNIEGNTFRFFQKVQINDTQDYIKCAFEALTEHGKEFFKPNKHVFKKAFEPFIGENGYPTMIAYKKKYNSMDDKYLYGMSIILIVNNEIYVCLKAMQTDTFPLAGMNQDSALKFLTKLGATKCNPQD